MRPSLRWHHKLVAVAVAIASTACATIPEPVAGGDNLPNASAGPFRALVDGELSYTLSRSAPFGLDDSTDFGRDITVVRASDDPRSLAVVAYVAAAIAENGTDPTASSPTRTIVRYGALDGRSFDRSATVALTADAAWEGGVLASPAAIVVRGETRLYYAAAGGIGLATSPDGTTFTKSKAPVLGPASDGWEGAGVPASPGVVQLEDGSFRMFYEVATRPGVTAIGEASSADGDTWARVGTAAALAPSGAAGAEADGWETAAVGSPSPMLATSGDGRSELRLYYGARDAAGLGTVALAARYGSDGALQRAVGPVFGSGKTLSPHEPCVIDFGAFTLLYATEASSTQRDAHPAIVVGLAPATATLPPPNPM